VTHIGLVDGVIVILVISLILGVIVLSVRESRLRASAEIKDWIAAVLREHIKMAKEYEEAREVAKRDQGGASDLELEAVALLMGRRRLLETFIRLTDRVVTSCPLDPLRDPPVWEGGVRPSEEEMEKTAALRFLYRKGYVSGVFPAGFGGYSIMGTNEARAVRAALDRLPETVKVSIRKERHHLRK
jgi:hypothetical protein